MWTGPKLGVQIDLDAHFIIIPVLLFTYMGVYEMRI